MDEPDVKGLKEVFAPVTVTLEEKTKRYFMKYSFAAGQDAYTFANSTPKDYLLYRLRGNLKRISRLGTQPGFKTNTLGGMLNFNFLRKERLYTKLKYSRSPAYDIVSGGSAALLAGFLGFLISEKFGFELVDSGDFYYGFMYVVFLGFSLKPLALVANNNEGLPSAFSLWRVFVFFKGIAILVVRFVCRK